MLGFSTFQILEFHARQWKPGIVIRSAFRFRYERNIRKKDKWMMMNM